MPESSDSTKRARTRRCLHPVEPVVHPEARAEGAHAARRTGGRSSLTRSRLFALLVVIAASAVACQPRTDDTVYQSGEVGEASFFNSFRKLTLWLGGCNAFVQQQLDAGAWLDRGGEIDCFWEGFAQPVAPRSERVDSFTARDPGVWRLAYDVGIGCRADQPLSAEYCDRITRITSNRFEVVATSDEETLCLDSGGAWDPLSCGHYTCGNFPECDAVIPGCDCGPGANFEHGVGCVSDRSCPPPDARLLCEQTGGIWDPTSCGHYSCGHRPICAAVIPGCNCGPSAVFDEFDGCLAAPCGAPID